MSIKPKLITTGIGSLPFLDPEYAVDFVLKNLKNAPFWPQLPQLGLNEHMEIQYSEGLPCVVIDREKNRMYFDTSGDTSDALGAFYETYMGAMDADQGTGDCSSVAISAEYSQGLHTLIKKFNGSSSKLPFLKVQTTGPCSFALNIVDENKRAIFYNDQMRDMIVKAMAMKCRWQIQKMQSYAEHIICFIDEPILSAFGSSTYVSVQREDIVAMIKEVVDAIHQDHALAGVHCCGNTEWSILIDAGVDILSFDAFEYGETLAIYADAVKQYLADGKIIAWGIIPTSKKIYSQTPDGLVAQLEKLMDRFVAKGIAKSVLLEQSFITPSCGTGSLTPEDAEKIFAISNEVSKLMRAKYGY
jgi:hypothetical protein